MARLTKPMKSVMFEYQDGQSWEDAIKNADEIMAKLMEASDNLGPGEVVGAMLSFPVADGAAVYRVTNDVPLTIQHIPYGDAWEIPNAHIRGINRDDVFQQLAQRKARREMFARS